MSTTPSVRRRLTAPARRERIEAAAVEVFAGRGYDAASVGAIAAAAGVSRTVLYDHFRDKRALYLHVLGTENAAMLAEVGAGITGAGAGRARMRATVAAYLSFAQQRPAARRLLVDPVPHRRPRPRRGGAQLPHRADPGGRGDARPRPRPRGARAGGDRDRRRGRAAHHRRRRRRELVAGPPGGDARRGHRRRGPAAVERAAAGPGA
ncbi:TetR/AcrR family transcriptional regulator [Pimelobacter simplex]|uniref:TetR/AcrR family transcriptional regulator n=1 Tax=Nocardioides simplex TaxID=2045 RepID=UPI00367194AE